MKRLALFVSILTISLFVTQVVFAKVTIRKKSRNQTATQVQKVESIPIVAKENVNDLPESYYNSLKVKPTSDYVVPSKVANTKAAVPYVEDDQDEFVEENVIEDVVSTPLSSDNKVKEKKLENKPKTTVPLAKDYNYGFTTSNFVTEIGKIRAELEALKTGVEAGKASGYDGGFFIKSADGKYKFNVNGIIQFRYSVNIAEDVEDGHTFRLRRLRFTFSGNAFSEKFVYTAVLNYPSGGLLAFEMGYEFASAFKLYASQGPIMINSGTMPSSSGSMTITGPAAMNASRYLYGNGLGIYAAGGFGFFNYAVGVVNGMNLDYGTSISNEMFYLARFDFDLVGKIGSTEGDLDWHEKPAFTFGFGAAFGHDDTGSQARIIGGAADLRFKYKGFSFVSGGNYRQIDPDQFTRAQTDVGVTAAMSYFVVPKVLELAVRGHAFFDDLTDVGLNMYMAPFGSPGDTSWSGGVLSGGDVDGDSENEFSGTIALGYYFNQSKHSKIQFEYTMYLDGIAGPDDRVYHVGQIQAQMGF